MAKKKVAETATPVDSIQVSEYISDSVGLRGNPSRYRVSHQGSDRFVMTHQDGAEFLVVVYPR